MSAFLSRPTSAADPTSSCLISLRELLLANARVPFLLFPAGLGNDVRFSSLRRNGPAERRKADRKEVQADRFIPTPNTERLWGSRHLNGGSCTYEGSPEVPAAPAPGPRRIHSGLTEPGTKGSQVGIGSPLSIKARFLRGSFCLLIREGSQTYRKPLSWSPEVRWCEG